MKQTYLTAILAMMFTFSTPSFGAKQLPSGSGNVDNGMPDGDGADEVYRGITLMGASDPNTYVRPAGNVIYRSAGNSNSCVTVDSVDPKDVFPSTQNPTTIDFTTGPASNFIEIQYAGQFSIGVGTALNRIFFRCSVSQDDGATYNPCSGISTNGLTMVRRVETGLPTNPFQLVTTSASYIGYVAVLPSTPTKLKLTARLEVVNGNSGTVCLSNAIVRY